MYNQIQIINNYYQLQNILFIINNLSNNNFLVLFYSYLAFFSLKTRLFLNFIIYNLIIKLD